MLKRCKQKKKQKMISQNKTSWFNETQISFVTSPQKIKAAVCGRGFGKTTMLALILFLIVKHLPRSKGFLAARTLEQITNEILPQIRKKLESLGLHEGTHYVVGIQPPEWFAKPISPIKDYGGAMTFWNGTIIRFLSHARPSGRRGGTYDWGIIDEALEMKETTFDTIFSQLIRGNLYTYTHALHHSLFIITSRPKKSFSFWIYRFRDLAKKNPEKYLWLEASAEDNKDALGQDWFDEQKDRLSPIQYQTEIENKEITQLPDGYYYLFQRGKHTYRPTYDSSRRMKDVRTNELLELSFDFGGKFSCMTVWQEHNGTEYCRRELFVKNERKLPALIDDFCAMFEGHEYKYARLWGEPRGRDENSLDENFYTVIQKRLKKNGWMSDIKTPSGYRTSAHDIRYTFLERLLGGDDALPKLMINEDACPSLVVALETTDVLADKGKDKSREKDDGYPQELATHLPDTLDYYLYLKYARNGLSARRAGTAQAV